MKINILNKRGQWAEVEAYEVVMPGFPGPWYIHRALSGAGWSVTDGTLGVRVGEKPVGLNMDVETALKTALLHLQMIGIEKVMESRKSMKREQWMFRR